MSLYCLRPSMLYVLFVIAGGLSVSSNNRNALRRNELWETNDRSFFTNNETNFKKLLNNGARSGTAENFDFSALRTKTSRVLSEKRFILRKRAVFATKNLKTLSSRKTPNEANDQAMRINVTKNQGVSISVRNEQRTNAKRKKKKRIENDRIQKNSSKTDSRVQQESRMPVWASSNYTESIVEKNDHVQQSPLEAPCRTAPPNGNPLSLRNLFHVPKVRKGPDCSSRKSRVVGGQRHEEYGQPSAIRSFDRGHTELINQYEYERSMDVVGVEYVHPEGHILSPPFGTKRIIPRRSVMINVGVSTDFSTNSNNSTIPLSERKITNWNRATSAISKDFQKPHSTIDSRDYGFPRFLKNHFAVSDTKDKHNNEYSLLKNKRQIDETLADVHYRRALSRMRQIEQEMASDYGMNEKLPNVHNAEFAEDLPNNARQPVPEIQSSTSHPIPDKHNVDDKDVMETNWPLVPGPISCDLDFQLRPSFVAKLGEFDYVVSVQRQHNPDVLPEHACTGVVYNPRFVIIAPHCLHALCDNYGLTVTSTDDLCTIDEVIQVDYIIEHENYDGETRANDIALIKLKSEIHKKPATFPKDDSPPGKLFYAVGFGELMWKSYPTKISKLLQKMPVQKYSRPSKESAGTIDITTSNLDLTGAFRGDFGGALISPHGEFVGLKSKLIKKPTEYEIYTRVRTYLPWIESMVSLHGSW